MVPSRIASSACSSELNTRALPSKRRPSLPVIFATAPSWSEVAVKNDEVAVLFDRIVKSADDLLTRRIRLHVGEILGHRFAGDGQAIAVQQTSVEQHLHQRPNAADGDEFGHQISAARLQVGEHGHVFADAVKSSMESFTLRGVRHGEQMQHGVGRTAQRDDDGDGVFKRFAAS